MKEGANEFTPDELKLIEGVKQKAEERKKNKQDFIKSLNIMSIDEYKKLYKDNFDEFYKNINLLYEFLKDENNFYLLNEVQRNIVSYLFDYYDKMIDRDSNIFNNREFVYLRNYIKNNKSYNKFKSENEMKNIYYLYDFNDDETKKYEEFEKRISSNPISYYNEYKNLPLKVQILEKNKFFVLINSLISDYIEYNNFKINDHYEYLTKSINKDIDERKKILDRINKNSNEYESVLISYKKYIKTKDLLDKNIIKQNDIFKKMESIGDVYNLENDFYSFKKINEFVNLYNELPFKDIVDFNSFYFDKLIIFRNKLMDNFFNKEKDLEKEFNFKSYIRIMYSLNDIKRNIKESIYIFKINNINNDKELLFQGDLNFSEMREKMIKYIKLYKDSRIIISKSNGAILFEYN